MTRLIFSCLTILFCSSINAQQQDLKTYLTATKTQEFEESQKIIKDLSFPSCRQYVFSFVGDISGLTFETDIKGVRGYKAIFNCKAQNKAGLIIEKRMMAILYFDKQLKKWRILDIREPLTACDEFQKAKTNIDISNAQYSWRNVSYWAMMCGKLTEAKEAIETSESRARAVNDKEFYNIYSDILAKIK